jgi:hypothetical protein
MLWHGARIKRTTLLRAQPADGSWDGTMNVIVANSEGRSDLIEGGCRCKSVRFQATGEILLKRQCWCRDCQYLACGAGSNGIIVRVAGLALEGQLTEFCSLADSGSHMIRRFCPRCGTQVFSAAEENPEFIVIRAGALDDPELARPESIIWTDSAPSWACLDPTIPHVAGQPVTGLVVSTTVRAAADENPPE